MNARAIRALLSVVVLSLFATPAFACPLIIEHDWTVEFGDRQVGILGIESSTVIVLGPLGFFQIPGVKAPVVASGGLFVLIALCGTVTLAASRRSH